MVLKFKRIGFFRKAKERREEPKSEVVCLKYVQHQEFDICYLRTSHEIRLSQFREPVQTETVTNDTNFQILNQSETTKPTTKISCDQSNGHMPEPEVQKKVIPRPRSFRQSDNTDGIVEQLGNTERITDQLSKREEEHREVIKQLETEGDESFVQSESVVAEEAEVVRPIAKPRSILKNTQVAPKSEEEENKKSPLIFMTENHEETKEEPPFETQIEPGEDGVEEEVEDGAQVKKSVMFDESNLSNKGQVIDKAPSVTDSDDDYDSDEYAKDFSNNAASIFFDGDDPEPVERMSRINLNRDSDEDSVQSQTSA